MIGPTQQELARSGSLDELYGKLKGIGLGAGWNKPTPSLWPAPRRSFPAAHWRYEQAKGALDAAGRLINTELAERRNLIMVNPLPGNDYASATTLVCAYQMIMPGEHARTHRHSPNALRLILDAEKGTYTSVNGAKLPMRVGDVVLTPNWSWHGHGNESSACAYWIDYLDVPLVHLLEPMFFEPHPRNFDEGTPTDLSPLIFPWAETERRLAAAAPDPSGRYGTEVELGDPVPALDTMALYMMRLDAGAATAPFRTTANTVYSVVSGEGETDVEDKQFRWRRGDVVVVPSWLTHSHRATRDAVLFRVSDAPVMAKLGFLRSEDR
jgi:gentisate 1,2-dioxygenase